MAESFDLIVIGGGTAGLVTAAGAAYLGARPLLVERDRLGGDCLWTGCVPSKALLASGAAAAIRRDAAQFGLERSTPGPDFASALAAMRIARNQVAVHDDPERFRALGVEVRFAPAELASGDTVWVGDDTFQSKRIVIATGSVPTVPPIPGLRETGFLNHRTVLDLTASLASVAIIGGGPIGVEFAQIFQRLGVPVTLLEMAPEILPQEDPEAAGVVRGALARDGVIVHTGVTVVRVEPETTGKVVIWRSDAGDERRLSVGEIFIATGRGPNVAGLNLPAAGAVVEPGGILVDPWLRTTRRGIWAAGDVSGGPQFTHFAEHQAKLVVRNALTPFRTRLDARFVPRVTYCDPELAQVGLTEAAAREQGGDVRTFRYAFADLDRAIVSRRSEGFVKLISAKGRRILGATIVGAGAGELLAPVLLAMHQKLPVESLTSFVYPYPTMSEGIKRAATLSLRAKLDTAGGRLLKWIVRASR